MLKVCSWNKGIIIITRSCCIHYGFIINFPCVQNITFLFISLETVFTNYEQLNVSTLVSVAKY